MKEAPFSPQEYVDSFSPVKLYRRSKPKWSFRLLRMLQNLLPNEGFLSQLLSWIVEQRYEPRAIACTSKRPKISRLEGLKDIESLDPFVYHPLASDQHIRYFDLAPGLHDDPIRGELFDMALYESCQYEAVSHVRGSEKHTVPIACNGRAIRVTTNLAAMLRHLRWPDQKRRLWIDELCINQADIPERAQQVCRMRDIYEAASGGILWLGEADCDTPSAFELLDEIHAWATATIPGYPDSAWPGWEDIKHCMLITEKSPRMNALVELLNDPWFSRTWILQEATLLPDAWIQRGYHTFQWSFFVHIVGWIVLSGASRMFGLELIAAYNVANICWMGPRTHDLFDVLSVSRSRNCTEHVDRVFALLGLAKDGHYFSQFVNYKSAYTDIFREVALHYLRKGDLRPLCLASKTRLGLAKGLPSWVPDWTAYLHTTPIYLSCREGVLEGRPGGNPSSSTARFSSTPPTISPDNRRLTLRAVLTDTVLATGRHIPMALPSPYQIYFLYAESWRRLAHRHLRRHRRYADWAALTEAFARTLVLGSPLDVIETASTHAETYLRTLQMAAATRRKDYQVPERDIDILWYYHQMVKCCLMRTFFVTKEAGMGMGPFGLRVGDQIVYADGGPVLYAVRPRKDGDFELVGEAYLLGRMWTDESLHERYEDLCLV